MTLTSSTFERNGFIHGGGFFNTRLCNPQDPFLIFLVMNLFFPVYELSLFQIKKTSLQLLDFIIPYE